jgi:hypothetical protein
MDDRQRVVVVSATGKIFIRNTSTMEYLLCCCGLFHNRFYVYVHVCLLPEIYQIIVKRHCFMWAHDIVLKLIKEKILEITLLSVFLWKQIIFVRVQQFKNMQSSYARALVISGFPSWGVITLNPSHCHRSCVWR